MQGGGRAPPPSPSPAGHIAEASDEKMDELEQRISVDDREVIRDLQLLGAVDDLASERNLEDASAACSRFRALRAQLLALSRENTHVRSLAISLNEKHRLMFQCQDALDALQMVISEEPITGVDYAVPSNPRQIRTEPHVAH